MKYYAVHFLTGTLALFIMALSAQPGTLAAEEIAKPAPQSVSKPVSKPFEASYRIEADGIPFKSKAVQTLSHLGDGKIQLSMKMSNFMSKLEETSTFSLSDDCQLKAMAYSHRRRILGSKKRYRIDFDWSTQKAGYITKADTELYSIGPGVADRLSEQIAIKCQVAQGKKDFIIAVADKSTVKFRHYRVLGDEIITTKDDTYNTVKVDRIRENSSRSSTFWLDKDRDLALVKLVQQQSDGDRFELELQHFQD